MAKYKYSGPKSKSHPKGDFRQEKSRLSRVSGGFRWYRPCEEFTNGRWEGFVAWPYGPKVFKTRAEAMKHKPKW